MKKIEAYVPDNRVSEIVDAVERESGHEGVTVVRAVVQRPDRTSPSRRPLPLESHYEPMALLLFIVGDYRADLVVEVVAQAVADEGDPVSVTTTAVDNVRHNRTGAWLAEIDA